MKRCTFFVIIAAFAALTVPALLTGCEFVNGLLGKEDPEEPEPGPVPSAITFAFEDNSVIDQITAAKTANLPSVTITMGTGTENVEFNSGKLLLAGLVLTTGTSPASVTIDGGGYTVDLIGQPSGNPLITVGDGVKLTLKNITLKGLNYGDTGDTANNTRALIRVDTDGELVLEAGAVISHNNNANNDGEIASNNWGGGVRVEGGTLTMSGGTISYNKAASGGGVYINNGALTMNTGTISDNIVESSNAQAKNGGGVYIIGTEMEAALFTMSNGTIANNKAVDGGGGVNVNSYTVFTMSGGTIQNNESKWGGGVLGHATNFTMSGGATIQNNTSSEAGGGVYLNTGSAFTMETGTISGNKATNNTGGGVHIRDSGTSTPISTFTMNNGTISGNTATSGGGVAVGADSRKGTFIMNGGTISGNTATTGNGGGVAVSGDGTFTKADTDSGTIYGATGNANANTATANDPKGHAVYVSDIKYLNSTAGSGVSLDSSTSDNWEP